jgi:hypothetical protein
MIEARKLIKRVDGEDYVGPIRRDLERRVHEAMLLVGFRVTSIARGLREKPDFRT